MILSRPCFASFAVASVIGCASSGKPPADSRAKPTPDDEMISLDGNDPVFAELGRKSFPHSKLRCFDASVNTLNNSGLGTERADLEPGTIVSRKVTVYRAEKATASRTTFSVQTVDNKFYVLVTGDDTSCTVAVTKLRAWSNTLEVDTRTRKWVAAHLRSFVRGVEEELADNP
jgi:hypothetical protein